MCDDDALKQNAVHVGGVQPHWPPFAGKTPPALPVITSCHDNDTLVVSLEGKPPEPVTCGHFVVLMRDGRSAGVLHVGNLDGTVRSASFAELRAFFYGPRGRQVGMTSAPAGHP